MVILIGQSLGRYHILEQLGEGGMATVYKAYDTRLERDVAIKIIRRGAFPPEQLDRVLKRFEREAKALAKLSQPNIVKVLDFGDYQGSPYLVMEYLPGGTLKPRLGKPIPWREAARLLLPIAHALQFAHGQNIIHRDVKPSNILITQSGEPMLSDFGIAKILESEEATALTGTGVGVGTPEYMAPEQWAGKVMPHSDIYSLGVIFYEMVTGRKPYIADTPPAILLKQATEPLPRPIQYVPDLPEGVEKVLLKALAKKFEDRYQSMGEFALALERLDRAAGEVAQKAGPSRLMEDEMETVLQLEETTGEFPTKAQSGDAALTEVSLLPESPTAHRQVSWLVVALGGFALLAVIVILILVVFVFPRINAPNASTAQPEASQAIANILVTPTARPTISPTPFPSNTPLPTQTPQAGPLNPSRVSASSYDTRGSNDSAGNPVFYYPQYAIDGEHSTCWRVSGNGIGEWLQLDFGRMVLIDQIGIIPGYDKVDPYDGTDRFSQNYVVRSVRIEFSDGTQLTYNLSYSRNMQFIAVGSRFSSYLLIIILDSYPPTSSDSRNFTAISEVSVTGWIP